MPGVTRLGDSTSCGGIAITASPNVLANGIPQHRITDLDTCAVCAPPSVAPVVGASPNVFANGLNKARCGDPDACPAVLVTCSGNVIVNG